VGSRWPDPPAATDGGAALNYIVAGRASLDNTPRGGGGLDCWSSLLRRKNCCPGKEAGSISGKTPSSSGGRRGGGPGPAKKASGWAVGPEPSPRRLGVHSLRQTPVAGDGSGVVAPRSQRPARRGEGGCMGAARRPEAGDNQRALKAGV